MPRPQEDLTRRQIDAFARLVSAHDRYNLLHNERLEADKQFRAARNHAHELGIDVSEYTID